MAVKQHQTLKGKDNGSTNLSRFIRVPMSPDGVKAREDRKAREDKQIGARFAMLTAEEVCQRGVFLARKP